MPHPNDPALRSFIPVDPASDFPIQKSALRRVLDRGRAHPAHRRRDRRLRLDLWQLAQDCRIDVIEPGVFAASSLNAFMALGPEVWSRTRARISELLRHDRPGCATTKHCAGARWCRWPMRECVAVGVAGYTDFYSSKEHATNVGVMFRGKDNALQPNWLHMPIGYNGRASTVVVSGTRVKRPRGQLKPPGAEAPSFGPCKRLDFELEMGVVVGQRSAMGEMLTEAQAEQMIFGFVILNDWSARDIQQWEYVPLARSRPRRLPPGSPVECVDAGGAGTVSRPGTGAGSGAITLSATETAQQLRSHTRRRLARRQHERGCQDLPHQFQVHVLVLGAAARAPRLERLRHEDVGDTPGERYHLPSAKDQRGSLLEISWNGDEPLRVGRQSVSRTFLEDGDALVMRGWCQGDGFRVGFGEVENVWRRISWVANGLFRHCERSEAIHRAAQRKMDCFVARAPRNDDESSALLWRNILIRAECAATSSTLYFSCTRLSDGGCFCTDTPGRHSRAGRIGRGANPPPQFGQTLPSFASTQSAQKVHS